MRFADLYVTAHAQSSGASHALLMCISPEQEHADQIRQLTEKLIRKDTCWPDQTRASAASARRHAPARRAAPARGAAPRQAVRRSARLEAACARKHHAEPEQQALPGGASDQKVSRPGSLYIDLTDGSQLLTTAKGDINPRARSAARRSRAAINMPGCNDPGNEVQDENAQCRQAS